MENMEVENWMRVYELAKNLNKTSKDVITVLKGHGVEVKNHMSSISDSDANKVKEHFSPKKKEEKKSEQQKNNKKPERRPDNRKRSNANGNATQHPNKGQQPKSGENSSDGKKGFKKKNKNNPNQNGKDVQKDSGNNKFKKKNKFKNNKMDNKSQKKKKKTGPGAFIKPEPVKKVEEKVEFAKIPEILTLKELAEANSGIVENIHGWLMG